MKTKILLIALLLLTVGSFAQNRFTEKFNEIGPSGNLYSLNTNDSSIYTQEYLNYCNQSVKDTVYQKGKIYKYISYDKPNDTTWNKLKYSEWKDDFTGSFLVRWDNSNIWNTTQFHFSGTVIELKEVYDRYYWVVVEDIDNLVEIWLKREKPSTYGFHEFERENQQ